MLGSLSEADDAVQEAWLRLSRADAGEVENLGGWLTTVVARVCLNMLRARNARREEPSTCTCPTRSSAATDELRPGAGGAAGRLGRPRAARRARHADPGRAAGVRAARHVRRAVRRDRPDRRAAPRRRRGSSPAGPGAGSRAPSAGAGRRPRPPARGGRRVLRGRARRRLRRAASRVLDPDVVLRADFGRRAARGRPGDPRRRGRRPAGADRPGPGDLPAGPAPASRAGERGRRRGRHGARRPFTVMGFTVAGGRIVEIDAIADPERVRRIAAAVLGDE